MELEIEQEKTIDKTKINFLPNYPFENQYTLCFYNFDHYLCLECRGNKPTEFNEYFEVDILRDLYALRNNHPCTSCKSNSILKIQLNTLKHLEHVIELNGFNSIYFILGSKQYNGVVEVKEKQTNRVYLEEMGIPKNSQVLDINFTPQGCGFFPLMLHSNNPRHRLIEKNTIAFYPTEEQDIPELPLGVNCHSKKLVMGVQWVQEINDISDMNLLNAIHNYIDNNQIEFIMNCNRAIEIIVGEICFNEFRKDGKKDEVESFLTSSATYGYQIKYLINLICKANSLIQIDKNILNKANTLRKLRNNIAHEGKLKGNNLLSHKEKVEYLAVTILITSILKYIISKINTVII